MRPGQFGRSYSLAYAKNRGVCVGVHGLEVTAGLGGIEKFGRIVPGNDVLRAEAFSNDRSGMLLLPLCNTIVDLPKLWLGVEQVPRVEAGYIDIALVVIKKLREFDPVRIENERAGGRVSREPCRSAAHGKRVANAANFRPRGADIQDNDHA